VIKLYKKRTPALSLGDRIAVISSFDFVDEVTVGDNIKNYVFNFVESFLKIRPQILAVTEDDKNKGIKKTFCEKHNCQCVVLKKTKATGTNSSGVRNNIRKPLRVPLRVDFAGGWLDVPKLTIKGGFVVNCSIAPLVSLLNWPYKIPGGLGGSAAWAILNGQNAFETEFAQNSGWQDPAIIYETGCCVWKSGDVPVLDYKVNPDWLINKMYLIYIKKKPKTGNLTNCKRDYDSIYKASQIARKAVINKNLTLLKRVIDISYKIQLYEGMQEIPSLGQAAQKYCGGGWGGYALLFFHDIAKPNSDLIKINPFIREPIHD